MTHNNKNFTQHIAIYLNRFICVVLLFLSQSIYAQFYQIRNFNAENGLASPEVYGLMQDSKGYMWFATDMGVSRYNGNEFDNFSTENGLPDNTVFGFCEDSKGRIWFRSFSGKLSYYLNDSIYTLSCNSFLEAEMRKKAVIFTSIYVDERDTVWIGTNYPFLFKISPTWNDNNVSKIDCPSSGGYLYLFNNNASISGGHQGRTSLVTVYQSSGQKICEIDPEVKIASRYYGMRLKNGTFLASVNNVLINFTPNQIISKVKLKSTINSLLEDKDGKIVSATYDGIRIHKSGELNKFEIIPDFYDKVFTGIVIDKENSLWLAAEGQGVYNIPFREGRYYTNEHGLIQSKISTILQKDGAILSGHLNGSVTLITDSVMKLLELNSKNTIDIFNNRVYHIYVHNKSDIYVCKRQSTFKLTSDFKSYKELDIVGIKKIAKSKGDMVWVQQARHIKLCNISKDFETLKTILFDQYIDDIFEDTKGILWISSINGLWKYEHDSLIFLGEQNKLLTSRIINIVEDKDGVLWMATRGKGVIVKRGKEFHNITQTNGLASNMCRNLFIDSENTIWVGSNNGLSKIKAISSNLFNYKIDVYTKKQGLLSNEVNYILSKGSNLILAHNNGISVLNPTLLKSNTTPPPVYITNVLNNSVNYKNDSISFLYNENYLKISYIGISYKNPGTVEYKYKMEGLDTSWVYTNYTSAQFQTLYPGNYKFIVYAKNNDGYWSEKPAVLYLSILPAWWQTWVFKLFVFGLFVALVFLIIRWRLDKIRKRESEKTELQNKIASTELKALRAQMNPHFIFNAINSVQYFMTSNDPESSQKYLSKFAKLIRYVMDNSKPASIPLEKELDALRLYIDLEALRFENRFEYQIVVDDKIDPGFIQIPSMLIQPYVENAIWHGLMHKKDNRKLSISINIKDSILVCVIQDNGIGREKSREIKSLDSNSYHKSFGMAVTKERLEIISRLNNINPQVNIIDLYENGIAMGTRVEISIPSF
jgi:ligand-binding sensor domain-containing protein